MNCVFQFIWLVSNIHTPNFFAYRTNGSDACNCIYFLRLAHAEDRVDATFMQIIAEFPAQLLVLGMQTSFFGWVDRAAIWIFPAPTGT